MKYVFYDVYYSASAPKTAAKIVAFMKGAVGCEMLTVYLEKFVATIRQLVEDANATGRVDIEMSKKVDRHYNDGCRHGQIAVYSKSRYGFKDIARLHFIEVDRLMVERYQSMELKQYTFNELDKKILTMEKELKPATTCAKNLMGEMKLVEKKESEEDRAEDLIIKIYLELAAGGDVATIADKYVHCATPELRQKLIDGMTRIRDEHEQKGGES